MHVIAVSTDILTLIGMILDILFILLVVFWMEAFKILNHDHSKDKSWFSSLGSHFHCTALQ